jgi:hypothetical protein
MAEPRDYLKEYLGINPLDYSAIESQIAGQSPFASETASIIPTVSNLPKPRLLSEMNFQDLTAPLMEKVYGRVEEARSRADDLASQLQALEAEKAQLAETETTRRAELEQQIQNLTQQRVEAEQQARSLQQQIETQAGDISGLEQQLSERTGRIGSLEELLGKRDEMLRQSEISLQEITQARDEFRRDAEQARQQQDVIRQQASEDQARSLEEQRQQLLAEREQIVGGLQGQLEQGQMVLAETESKLQEITALRDQALADAEQARLEQDVIRQQASENLARSLEEQRQGLLSERESIIQSLESEFGVERGELEGKIGELESIKTGLESDINDLSSQIRNLEAEKQDAIAQQDVIRAEAAQQQQDALSQQAEQFSQDRDLAEQKLREHIAQLEAQLGGGDTQVTPSEPSPYGGTPFDQYLRDQEQREMGIDLGGGLGSVAIPVPSMDQLAGIAPQMPNQDAIQKGIEELYGRVTAGGGKPEDFTIYKPPAGVPTPTSPAQEETFTASPAVVVFGPDGKMYGSPAAAKAAGVTNYTMTPPGSKPFPNISGGEKPPIIPPSTPRPSPLVSQPPKPSLDRIANYSTDRQQREINLQPIPRSQQGVGNILLPPMKPTTPSPAFPSRTPLASMRPPMRFAGGGSLDQALHDLRLRLSK